MADPKHPQGGGAVTPQTEGGAHPRGTEAKSHTRDPQDQPGPDSPSKGEHIFPEDATQVPDARRNPGIMSPGGTTDSGEPGIDERDEDAS